MRIGIQPQPTVVAQHRARLAEASDSLAKTAPRFQVGRVAAFVQHINNGTFGSADTRAFRSSAKPAALAGSPAKAGAPVVCAAPSTERMPALPPLKSPALVLALTGVVNRGGESSTPSVPAARPLPVPTQAVKEMRDMRKPALARPRSTFAATTRLQRIGTRAPEGSRKPAPPERYQGILRAERSEIHLHAVVARAESVLSPSPDAGACDGTGSGDGNWDLMAEFEPFKGRIDRVEVAMHPSIVGESETSLQSCIDIDGHEPDGMDGGGRPAEIAGSSVQAWDADDGVDSDWVDDFDGDSDSDFEDDIDADPAIQSDAGAPDQRNIPETPEQRFRREGEEVIAAGLTWALRAAQQRVAATDTSQTVVQEGAVQQLKLDVLRYRPELEAYDQLPLATRMVGVDSARRSSGVSDAEEQQASFLGALKKFDRDTLRTVDTAQAGEPGRIASLVEQMFSRSFVHMQNENKSLINESDDDSGVDDAASVHADADADWDSDA